MGLRVDKIKVVDLISGPKVHVDEELLIANRPVCSGYVVTSDPPEGFYTVTNLYVNTAGKLEVKYETENVSAEASIVSSPPVGHFRVVNLFVDSTTGKLIVRYSDEPWAP